MTYNKIGGRLVGGELALSSYSTKTALKDPRLYGGYSNEIKRSSILHFIFSLKYWKWFQTDTFSFFIPITTYNDEKQSLVFYSYVHQLVFKESQFSFETLLKGAHSKGQKQLVASSASTTKTWGTDISSTTDSDHFSCVRCSGVVRLSCTRTCN